MGRKVSVTFTDNSPAPDGGIVPGTWTFGDIQDASPDGTVHLPYSSAEQHVVYKLSSDSTSGWGFKAISISQESKGTTYVSVTGATAQQSYSWGQIEVHDLNSDLVRLYITNKNSTGQKINLGVVLTLTKDDEDQQQTSRDPQIVLKPKNS